MKKQISAEKIGQIRHSLAHLLAMAVLEKHPEVKLGIGPVIENGFYYDFDFSKIGHSPSPDCLPKLEQAIKKLIKKNLKFEREEITAKKAEEIFRGQPFKLELIKELQENKSPITIYAINGPESHKLKNESYFTDLCKGPHVASAKEIDPESFKLTKIAGAYWRGDEKNPMLVRIYGVAFADKKELDDYLALQKEIEKRDHRKLGEKLDLFSFHDIAPGAPFWHPKGMIIFKELEKYWRQIHDESGYQEISTPIMVKASLFEQSGHMKHYRENMFRICAEKEGEEKEECYLKPMNCPESTYVYRAKIRSYRDLPLRLSEIGRLHRNELSGALGGMFRVRQITMDDAHIFCRPDQIQNEIKNVLTLIKKFYKLFNLTPNFFLSTKPDEAMGDLKLWEKAESSLEHALKTNKLKYEIKPKDGAFYGPKIDIQIKDALGRDWQLATIQLDFQQPENFNLEYVDEKGVKQRPVMIHRAVFGS
ncbi:MAG: threonine--tRNA ligase, partial [Patescibacteria group bacterium]